jgi:hypothetical protein
MLSNNRTDFSLTEKKLKRFAQRPFVLVQLEILLDFIILDKSPFWSKRFKELFILSVKLIRDNKKRFCFGVICKDGIWYFDCIVMNFISFWQLAQSYSHVQKVILVDLKKVLGRLFRLQIFQSFEGQLRLASES